MKSLTNITPTDNILVSPENEIDKQLLVSPENELDKDLIPSIRGGGCYYKTVTSRVKSPPQPPPSEKEKRKWEVATESTTNKAHGLKCTV